jgi:two-component system cell cycle sensor histidine kinase/response regulator CckA
VTSPRSTEPTRSVRDDDDAIRALEASERLFRAIVEVGADCVALFGADNVITYASPALLDALGYEAHEMLGHLARDFVHPDDAATADAAGPDAPPDRPAVTTLRLRHKDGSWRRHEGTSTNLLHDPAVRAVVSNRRDVTARIAEDERVAFQAALLAEVDQPVVATDATGRLTYWNEAASRLYGWSVEEVIGKSSKEVFRPRWPQGTEEMYRALSEVGSWRGPLRHTTRAGEHLDVEVSIRMQLDEQRKSRGTIAVIQDVTARRLLEEQLMQSRKMEAIGLLAGGVAHDFNNLLAVITGYTELALRKLRAGDPVAAHLDEVRSAAGRGADLGRKLLALSRRQILRPGPVDVGDAVRDFVRLMERIVGEDVELAIRLPSEPVVARADAVQLEQVLLNLCTNARQAMPHGGRLGVVVRASDFDEAFVARHPWARAGAFAEITVSDTGAGMDDATRTRAFEPFFTTREEGTGLGLATVYGVVRQHGGLVRLQSEVGAGTTVSVYLPRADGTAAPPGRVRAPSLAPTETARGGEVILLAEDEPSLRALVATTLTELGYHVITTSDGEEALRAYERHAGEIALVVLDVVMPRLGAREVYERMRTMRPDVKVLLTTGYAPESTRMGELFQRAAVGVLEKPFTTEALAASVRRAIDG